MSAFVIKALTAWRLGVANIGRVMWYRLGVKFGLNPVRTLTAPVPEGPFFTAPKRAVSSSSISVPPYTPTVFGLKQDYPSTGDMPLWHQNVLTSVESVFMPWWQLPDFVDGLGDIKGVWEASRFDWVLGFSLDTRSGNCASLTRLNRWLADWCEKNPPYIGANWKCGQEASIRVMHLAMAARLLNQVSEPEAGLIDLVRVHLRRIAPTLVYAIAQDNNHGTSEAAALFIGGSWLFSVENDEKAKQDAWRWMKAGRKWLENRARRLIERDGSFSQYSLNYHRVMLDTYAIAELWRRTLDLPAFSSVLIRRLQAATAWLGNMVSPDGTDAPNLGANDGARLLPLSTSDYRDLRPSVQLASVLFSSCRAYSHTGAWNESLHWLKIRLPDEVTEYRQSVRYDEGGFAVVRDGDAMLLLRYPRFRFRPGQSDLLHLDFWKAGTNVFRDAGSYSYNCEEPWQSYFPGSAAHNTIQFDGRDAMPRLSRFLYGAWPEARNVTGPDSGNGTQTFTAGYRDWKGACHRRSVSLGSGRLEVVDDILGFEQSAVLRWRLPPGEWRWDEGWLVGYGVRLRVEASQRIKRCELVEGWESRYYSRKTPLPVLEVEVEQPGRLTTELRY